MGCCEFNRKLPKTEDEFIKKAELQLGFHRHTAEAISDSLYRFRQALFLNANNFLRVVSTLKLANTEQTREFYDRFKLPHSSNYSMPKLNILSVLFGRGSVETKIGILFDSYDADGELTLDQAEIKEMIIDLLDITLHLIPSLCMKLNVDEQELLRPHAEKLLKHKQRFTEKFLHLFYKPSGRFTKAEFIQKFNEECILVLLAPAALRTLVSHYSNKRIMFQDLIAEPPPPPTSPRKLRKPKVYPLYRV